MWIAGSGNANENNAITMKNTRMNRIMYREVTLTSLTNRVVVHRKDTSTRRIGRMSTRVTLTQTHYFVVAKLRGYGVIEVTIV